jgi:DNA-binding NarL/FixJ family response regulator
MKQAWPRNSEPQSVREVGLPAQEQSPTPPTRRSIRVLVVDDHAVVRQALTHLLRAEPDIEVVGEAADGRQAVHLTGELQPDIVTMDIQMPVMDGIEATRQIRAEWPAVHVIGVSMFSSPEYAFIMKEVGVSAYLLKTKAAALLVSAIRACMNPAPRPLEGDAGVAATGSETGSRTAEDAVAVEAQVKEFGPKACGVCHTPFRTPPKP